MVANLPSLYIEEIVSEARRCVEDLGAVTIMMPSPQKGEFWDSPKYDAIWALAIELDFPVSSHGVNSGLHHSGSRYAGMPGTFIALEHAIGFPFENMISFGHLIYSGILEGNAGWLPFWLGRLDDHLVGQQGVLFDHFPPCS